MHLVELEEFLFCIFPTCNLLLEIFYYISANEICKSKNKSKITVKDVLEAMEKAGFEGFQPEIESLLMGKEIIN